MDTKMYFYENFAKDFDSKVNMYDTNKRLEVFFSDMLSESDIKGKTILDAGCGTGWFGAKATTMGAIVTSMDLGENLLNEVSKKCDSNRVVGSIMEMPFADNSFDFVVSSEVIEHVPEPKKAIEEIYRVLKPGGIAVISTPNKLWKWTLLIANLFNLRPYQGLENWSSYWELKTALQSAGFKVEKSVGIHAFPFVVSKLNPILDFLHNFRHVFVATGVNLCFKVKK